MLEEASDKTTALLVMRDDFYSRLAEDAPVWWEEKKWLPEGLVQIPGGLSKDELVAIVRAPATAVGLAFEGDLVETIVSDALKAASYGNSRRSIARTTILPLLEFALTQLWKEDHREGWLTPESYRRIGGVTGGLRKWAKEAYGSLSEELQPLARRVLTDLVHLGDDSEGVSDSRRRKSLDDLCRNAREKDAVRQVIQHLTDARLLVTSHDSLNEQTSVEIIHDALLREWKQLREWLREDRDFLLWREEIVRRSEAWIKTDSE